MCAAILDMRLGAQSVSPVAQELSLRKIPFIFYTGQTQNDPMVAEWPSVQVVGKPAAPREILAAINRTMP